MKKNSVVDLRLDVISDKVKQDNKSLTNVCMGKKKTATLRKDGRWQVYANVAGKRKACYGKTEYKANYAADIIEAKEQGDDEVLERISGEKRFSFGNCFLRYRNYLLFYTNLTWETVDRYENTYNRYFPGTIFDEMDIRKIDSEAVSKLVFIILKKFQKLSNKEWQRIKHIIKATINFSIDEELDDFTDLKMPEINWEKITRRAKEQGKIYNSVKKQYAVSISDKKVLEEKIINENVYPEKFAHVLMLVINFSLGLRVGELAALKVENVDMVNHVVYVKNSCKTYKKRNEYGNAVGGYEHTIGGTKTPKGERAIPMSYNAQRLFEVLFQYRKEMGFDSPYLAYDGSDEAGREKALGKILRRFCQKTEIEDFTTHIIRKSFATALCMCPDIDIATISEYMGHAQVSTTVNNYLIPVRETLEEKRAKISQVL